KMVQQDDITILLEQWSGGDKAAFNQLFDIVYKELRRIAESYIRKERPAHTLQPTALVHEAYLRLVDQKRGSFQSRAHFFGLAARIMRHILVDYARLQSAEKRGNDQEKVSLDEAITFPRTANFDLIAIDDALTSLAKVSPRQTNVVELKFFGGLSMEEIGEALGVNRRTIDRDWQMAKLWLTEELDRKRL
ncbi:MAG: sigma-70 family RNA polymerase sigma factor, partial [Acidobacteriota bacterium]